MHTYLTHTHTTSLFQDSLELRTRVTGAELVTAHAQSVVYFRWGIRHRGALLLLLLLLTRGGVAVLPVKPRDLVKGVRVWCE